MNRENKYMLAPHKRTRRDYWPKDVYCRGYYSSVIPKYWTSDNSYENKISDEARHLLGENERLLQEQYHEVCFAIPETMLDKRQAERGAKSDMRDYYKQERLDSRDAAIKAGACDVEYTGKGLDDCRGQGIGEECARCSGQIVKLDDATIPVMRCELLDQ